MTARFLLDTNVISEPLRQAPGPELITRLETHGHEVATAAPVWYELRFGCARLPDSARKAAIGNYLNDVIAATIPILPYDDAAAAWHAAERARLERLGRTPPFVDGQIAAVAAVNDLVLVTANTDDFTDFAGLRVENWLF